MMSKNGLSLEDDYTVTLGMLLFLHCLIGVDMSDGELNLTRQKLINSNVSLFLAKAQSLPLIDNSVDIVISHMAFMLMDQLEAVAREIDRVLKPGGEFSAIVGAKTARTDSIELYIQLVDEAFKLENLKQLSNLGDHRMRSEPGIQSFFATMPGIFEPPKVENHVLYSKLSTNQAVEFFINMYEPGMLSQSGRIGFEENLPKKLKDLENLYGPIDCRTGLNLISVKKIG